MMFLFCSAKVLLLYNILAINCYMMVAVKEYRS